MPEAADVQPHPFAGCWQALRDLIRAERPPGSGPSHPAGNPVWFCAFLAGPYQM